MNLISHVVLLLFKIFLYVTFKLGENIQKPLGGLFLFS